MGGMSHQWCVRGRFARTAVGRRADGRAAYVSRGQPVDVRNHEDPTPRSSDQYNLFLYVVKSLLKWDPPAQPAMHARGS